ncbi:PQQ-binding-like beta-propeller repeat protein [Streptomyces sp. NPDC002766]|uniref:PQQ-binding-like beta-propeller repeat protein n=1 Tax=unclassified Streptomyces TaxID=2593676 RepID=UPI00331B03E2
MAAESSASRSPGSERRRPLPRPTRRAEERWRLETVGEVHATPVVVDGTVYVGSDDDFLYAIHT